MSSSITVTVRMPFAGRRAACRSFFKPKVAFELSRFLMQNLYKNMEQRPQNLVDQVGSFRRFGGMPLERQVM